MQGLCQAEKAVARARGPQPGSSARKAFTRGQQQDPRELRGTSRAGVFLASNGSPNTRLSFCRSAPTGWAQRLAGPACHLCPRRPTDPRRHCATRPLPLPPRTFSLLTSRRPTRSRRCPMARAPTPPPPFRTWPRTLTAV